VGSLSSILGVAAKFGEQMTVSEFVSWVYKYFKNGDKCACGHDIFCDHYHSNYMPCARCDCDRVKA